MKLLLGTVLGVALLIIGFYIYKTYREKHKLAMTVRRILQIGFVIVLFNIISLYTYSEQICLIAYSVYYIAVDWLLYYLFQFSLTYIGNDFDKHVNRKLLILLLAIDSVSVACNYLFEHLFSLNEVMLFGGEHYYELITTPLFYTHYVLNMMIVAFCLISLFYKAIKAPYFYRRKYVTIGVILVILVIMNIFSFKSAIDISVAGYVVEGICIYYCTFVYTPQRLLSKTLLHVAQDMSVALFVLDVEGKKLYSNTMAEGLLSEENPFVDRDGMTLEQWCRRQYMDYNEEFTKEQRFYRDEEELVLKIQLQRMVDSHKQLQGGYFVIQDRTEEINNLKKERYLATHDSLTGLYNKEYFYEKSARYIRRNPDKDLLMICTDIKDFKMINDYFGTKTGDIVLVNFARILRERVKDALIYGRLGNDIFGILIPKDKYREDLFFYEAQEAFTNGAEGGISFFTMINYIGVYEITERELPVSVMCDRARMAISTIKGDYHKRVAYYDKALRENIRREQELISDLDEAIEKEQLQIYLQPQVSAKGKVIGSEALIRWIHPEKGAIMPNEFIPIFEKNGLIIDIDRYIWEMACRILRKWKEEGRDDVYISVNISPRDFYFLNVYQIFVELVEKYDIDPQNLKLEITETAVVMDLKRQLELITRLRQTGFIVEMDDFGSGYSSLNMLKEIHVDVLKIDMAFLKKAKDEERSKKILQMIIGLSKQLGMPVITEGVEIAQQVEFLAEMGCDIFQGYYFGKPMSVQEFEAKYF